MLAEKCCAMKPLIQVFRLQHLVTWQNGSVVGDGHEPHRGLYAHCKDSLMKVG